MVERLVSERNFYGGSEGITSRLYQTYESYELSRQISTFEWCCAYRKTFGRNCGRWKLALPTKTKSRHQMNPQMISWTCATCAAFSFAKASARGNVTNHRKICAVHFLDSFGIINKIHSHQCITYGAKMLRSLFFLGCFFFLNVAMHDIIAKISGLVGIPCVCQLCVG